MSETAVYWKEIEAATPAPPPRRAETMPVIEEKTVLIVVLDQPIDAVERLVERLTVQHVISPGFRPVFLTDCSDSTIFRRHDWAFEYVMPFDEWSRFHDPLGWGTCVRDRVATMMATFEPDLMLHYMSESSRDLTGTLVDAVSDAVARLESKGGEEEEIPERLKGILGQRRALERKVNELKARVKELERRDRNRRMAGRIRELVRPLLPKGAEVLMVSKGDPALLSMGDMNVAHFPQGPGAVYSGAHPANSSEAIGHLEALRAHGAEYLVIPGPYRWWLDFYEDFRDHLDRAYLRLLDHPDCVVFWLVGRGGSGR